jgi:simple sugar transport system substrate-binding protein
VDRAQLLRRLAAGAAAAPLAGLLRTGDALAAVEASNFPPHPRWTFAFVTPETTNPLFVSLQYGMQDAAALLNCAYEWTGSPLGVVREAVQAIDEAIANKVDGIAVALADPTAFNAPVARALKARIPVVAFNVDAPGNRRLAFTGVDPGTAGREAARKLLALTKGGEIGLLLSQGADATERARHAGAAEALKKAGIRTATHRPPDSSYEAATEIAAWARSRRGALRGLLSLDASASDGAGIASRQVFGKNRPVIGGYGVFPAVLNHVAAGDLAFTVDEQPYLQGFHPLLQLFLYKLSGGLIVPSRTRTGPLFVTKSNVKPYVTTHTRYEGSSSRPRFPIA